jgi:hypothetical protein
MAVNLPHHPTSTGTVCFYFTDFLSTSLFDRFLTAFLNHTLSIFLSRDHTYSCTTLFHTRHTIKIPFVIESPSTAQPYLSRFDLIRFGVKKNHLYNMDRLRIHEPTSNQMSSTSLVQYVKSYHRHTLHFNETTGDITWKSKQGPTWVNQYTGDPTPYTTLESKSDPVDPFHISTCTLHAINAIELYESIDDIQDLFHVQSTLADEGLVGITYLWKWVKRMLVLPYWQRRVLVSFASDIPSGDLEWYTIGISISLDVITLCIKDRIWEITIARLLAADLEDISPFASIGESLLLSEMKCKLKTTGSLAFVSDSDTDTESSTPSVPFTVSVLH